VTEHFYLPEDKVVRLGVEALVRDLGPVEAVRFLSLRQQRILDSVIQHRRWQDSLDRERFFDQVFGAEKRKRMRTK
jgi:hypothetical protein